MKKYVFGIFITFFLLLLENEINSLHKYKSKKNRTVVLTSFNFISTPHYFPDYGLNVNNEDPFGNKFNSKENKLYAPGELSFVGVNQTKELAKTIYAELQSSLKQDEIFTLSIKVKRDIDAGRILNEELMKLNKITIGNHYVKKFDYRYMNTSLKINNVSVVKQNDNTFSNLFLKYDPPHNNNNNNTKNYAEDDIFTFYIPTEYEQRILPFNFNLMQCPKMKFVFETNLNSDAIKSSINFYFKDIIKAFYSQLRQTNRTLYERMRSDNYINYLNFTESNLNSSIEANRILTDYYLNYKTIFPNKNFTSVDKNFTIVLFYGKNTLLDLKAYDLFLIKNFSNDFSKVYLNGIFKYLLQILYSKLVPNLNDVNSKLKLVNFMVHDYNLAGIYKAIINPDMLIPAKEKEFLDINNLPRINYASRININVVQDLEALDKLKKNKAVGQDVDPSSTITVQIGFNNKVMATLKLSEFIDKMNANIITDDTFFDYLC